MSEKIEKEVIELESEGGKKEFVKVLEGMLSGPSIEEEISKALESGEKKEDEVKDLMNIAPMTPLDVMVKEYFESGEAEVKIKSLLLGSCPMLKEEGGSEKLEKLYGKIKTCFVDKRFQCCPQVRVGIEQGMKKMAALTEKEEKTV